MTLTLALVLIIVVILAAIGFGLCVLLAYGERDDRRKGGTLQFDGLKQKRRQP